jgi:hypothetical protein
MSFKKPLASIIVAMQCACLVNQASASVDIDDTMDGTQSTLTTTLTRNGTAAICAPEKTAPGSQSSAPYNAPYKTFTLYNNGPERCVKVSFDVGTCVGDIHLTAYETSFNSANFSQNYLGDAGVTATTSNQVLPFSFIAPANSAVVLVAQRYSGTAPCTYGITAANLDSTDAWTLAPVSNGDATYALDAFSFDDTPTANLTGVSSTLSHDHLYLNGWWYRLSGDTQEHYFPAPSSKSFTANRVTLTWDDLGSAGLFAAQLVWTVQDLDGAGGTTPSGRLTGKLTIKNLTGAAQTINLFHMADFDLQPLFSDDSASLASAGRIGLSDGGGSTAIYAASSANNYLVRASGSTDVGAILNDTAVDNFDSTGLPFGPGDFTGGWQWLNKSIAANGNLTVSVNLGVNAGQTFNDVSTTSFATDHIMAIKAAGITTGCVPGVSYCPSNNVTREQMAAFLVRAVEGEPASTYCDSGIVFNDVSTSSVFCKYIKRLYELGITTGCVPNVSYCPSDNVTREQMAAFLVRAIEGNPGAGYCGATQPFTDVSTSSGFCGHIKRLVELGVTTGCGGGNYCPADNVTREQMAAFLARGFLGM